jgi:hypothetical protein
MARRGAATQDKELFMAKAIPELSLDTQILERQLRALAIGEAISYLALSRLIGRDVQHDARGNLVTARRRLLQAERMVFGVITNEGLKRLSDEGKIETGRSHVQRAHTQAKLARKKTSAVDDFNALSNDQKIAHNVIMAQAGVIQQMTSTRNTRRLEGRVITTQPSLSIKAALELMKPSLRSSARKPGAAVTTSD